MLREVVILDHFRISNCFVRQNRRQTLSHKVVLATDPVPFLSFVLEAVDVQGDQRPTSAKDRSKGCVRGIADQGRIVTLWNRMQRGQESMYDCIKVFVTNGRQDFQAHALKLEFSRTDVVRTTIDCDIVPARGQTRGQMLSKGFKTAVVCGDAPRA